MCSLRDAGESLPIFQRKGEFIVGCSSRRVKHYILGDVLGEGSCGKVYEATDENTKELCAMKVIRKRNLLKIPGGLENVQREVEILKQLNHKHCIRLIEHFSDDEKQRIYIVCEHVGGGSIQNLCERAPNKRLPLHQARKLFEQLLDALEYLHSLNIIHRDIKLDNVLLTESGDLKLSDFGAAMQLGKQYDGAAKKCCGSPAFQPPELLSNKSPCGFYGPKLDIWAAGVVLYMMCIGVFPFEGTSICALFKNISDGLLKIPAWVDPSLSDLIHSILNKDYTQRFSIQQIREHPWMSMKLKREKSLPIVPKVSSFTGDRVKPACQCLII